LALPRSATESAIRYHTLWQEASWHSLDSLTRVGINYSNGMWMWLLAEFAKALSPGIT
jgi:hypothetical protein